MNILMIHPHDIYAPSEPWTVRIKKIALQFKEKGHNVKLAYFPLDARQAYSVQEEEGLEVISLDRRVGGWRLFKNTQELRRLARWADILHFQKCYYYAAIPALMSAWLAHKPIHYDWDDWETKIFYYSNPRQYVIGEFLNILEHLIPRLTDTISVSSEHLRQRCLKIGVGPEKIFMAPVGADLKQFQPGVVAGDYIKNKYGITHDLVLYVGQLHGGQYAELFIKAASLIISQKEKATFMVVGDGYRLRELKDLTACLGLESYFIFTGPVPYRDVPSYMAAADICVACFEDNDITRCKSPLKIAEYLAMGKAIVASNVGEVRRMVGGVGVMVEPSSARALASGIMRLLKDKKLRQDLGWGARRRAESRYNWPQTASNLLAAYEQGISLNEPIA